MNRRHPITTHDAAAQADTLMRCPRFLRDVGIAPDGNGEVHRPGPPEEHPLIAREQTAINPIWRWPLILFAALAILGIAMLSGCDTTAIAAPQPQETAAIDADTLFAAIVAVESGGNANAVGDNGLAVGIAQIQPVMIHDVNRILGREVFTLDDRTSPQLSRLVFDTFARHYGAGRSAEWIAKSWVGGPTWERRETARRNAEIYWRRIEKAL